MGEGLVMAKFWRIAVLVLVILFVLPQVYSADQNLVNSRDWRDVYSAMLFGSLQGTDTKFLTSTNHAKLILNSIPKERSIDIYSSSDSPFVANYRALVSGEGYSDVNEDASPNLNLELAEQLGDIDKFIIIDDSYGYNAIAAAPYAAVDNYYVLFADSGNIGDVDNFLSDKNPSSVILFGQLDASVKEQLAKYNPLIINKGDRFENNIEMVNRYLKVKPTKQVVLTNGEFIEQSLMSGTDPVLFIGKANVPEKIKSYIGKSDFEVAILIGNELIGVATSIRREIGISVFVKFAQGARAPSGPISQVEDLDRFPMPTYQLGLDIDSATYNTATNTLEVTYRNTAALAAYFVSTINVLPDNKTLKDDEPVFIDGNEIKTVLYSKTTAGDNFVLESLDAEAEITAFFGESPNSMENSIIKTVDISRIAVLDDSEIELEGLVYDKSTQRFYVTIKNIGLVDAYTKPELVGVIVNDEPITRSADSPVFIKKGDSAEIPIKLKLSEADILDNEQVTVKAYYGVRENSLTKTIIADFVLELREGNYLVFVLIAVLLVIIIIFLVARKECPVCRQKNMIHNSRCRRCRAPFNRKR